jgi:hypothetical protein
MFNILIDKRQSPYQQEEHIFIQKLLWLNYPILQIVIP